MLRSTNIIRSMLLKRRFRPSIHNYLTRTLIGQNVQINQIIHSTLKPVQNIRVQVLWKGSVRMCSNLPQHYRITMPALSPTMSQGTVISWNKKEGDKLEEGDILAEIESDKHTSIFETPNEGYLAKILVQAGTRDIAVGALICVICVNQQDVEKFKSFKDPGGTPEAVVVTSSPPAQAAKPQAAPPSSPAPVKPAASQPSYPPHALITLPALSPTMETGNIGEWKKKVGDALAEGDILIDIETDKSSMSFETPEEGFLANILIQSGEKDVPIGKLLCIIVKKKEDIDAFKNYTGPKTSSPVSSAPPPTPLPTPASTPPPTPPPTPSEPKKSAASKISYPPHSKVLLPALSPTMETGNIGEWKKKEGDILAERDALVDIETDKSTITLETPEEGFLAKIVIKAGEKRVPIGKLLCIVVPNKEDVPAFKNYVDSTTPPPRRIKKSDASQDITRKDAYGAAEEDSPAQGAKQKGNRVYASPMAQRFAELHKVRLEGKGSGRFGSFKSTDVLAMKGKGSAVAKSKTGKEGGGKSASSGAPHQDIDITSMRKVIANRLVESKRNAPHFCVTTEVNLDEILKSKKIIKEQFKKDNKQVSINDFIIKATALACVKVPDLNCAWMDKFIRYYNVVNVCVAVATDKGLYTPVVFDADIKSLTDISNDVRKLVKIAKDGKLGTKELSGGTITISNLGMFGVTQFIPIINPPQAAILAIGGQQTKVIPAKDGKTYKPANYMLVTLACDHRAVDGANAAIWLNAFKANMEHPVLMLL